MIITDEGERVVLHHRAVDWEGDIVLDEELAKHHLAPCLISHTLAICGRSLRTFQRDRTPDFSEPCLDGIISTSLFLMSHTTHEGESGGYHDAQTRRNLTGQARKGITRCTHPKKG